MMDIDWANGVPLMVGPIQIGHAEPSPETAGYWKGIKQEKLMIKTCDGCSRHHHPRRIFCQYCNSDSFTWVEVKGTGTVYSFSTVYRAPSEEFVAELPYTVGIVELDEGVHVFSRILGPDGNEPSIGKPVKLTFQQTGNWGRLPAFVQE